MGLFDIFRKKKSDNSGGDFYKELQEAYKGMHANALDVDELPGGVGEFGLEPDNPIPTNSKLGSMQYLDSLVTEDGHEISYRRVGSFKSNTFPGTPVDGYTITRSDGKLLGMLYLCMYHKRNSSKAPNGYMFRKAS